MYDDQELTARYGEKASEIRKLQDAFPPPFPVRGMAEDESDLLTASKQHLFGLVDARCQIRRSPLVRMQLLDESAVCPSDVLDTRPGLKAKDLTGLLLRHFSRGS
jgi:hypothetical protein